MSSAQTILSMETDNPLASSDEDSEKVCIAADMFK